MVMKLANKRNTLLTDYWDPQIRGKGFANNPRNNQQALVERMNQRILTELCMNRFEWKGLPDSIEPRFLELQLFYNAVAVFYKDDATGELLCAKGSGAGAVNFNDNPTSFWVIGSNMQGKRLEITEAVPVYANMLRAPDLDIVLTYSRKLAAIDRTIEINIEQMRYTKIIKTNQSTQLSMENIDRQIQAGVSSIKVHDSLDLSAIDVLDVGIPVEAVPNLLVAESKIWNKCMGLLGINNANQDKKERLVAAEVGANDEQVNATRNIALNSRQYAAKQINDMFGTNITVDFGMKESSDAESDADTESKDKDK